MRFLTCAVVVLTFAGCTPDPAPASDGVVARLTFSGDTRGHEQFDPTSLEGAYTFGVACRGSGVLTFSLQINNSEVAAPQVSCVGSTSTVLTFDQPTAEGVVLIELVEGDAEGQAWLTKQPSQ